MASLFSSITSGIKTAKNALLNLSEVEVKVLEATSNEPWGPTTTEMREIARASHYYANFPLIMNMIWKRLGEDLHVSWRPILKTLTLLEYLLKVGSPQVAREARVHTFTIQQFSEVVFVEGDIDHGLAIREKAKAIHELLQDENRLREEREKAKQNMSKFMESASNTFNSSSFGSGGAGGGGSGGGGGYDDWGNGGSHSGFDNGGHVGGGGEGRGGGGGGYSSQSSFSSSGSYDRPSGGGGVQRPRAPSDEDDRRFPSSYSSQPTGGRATGPSSLVQFDESFGSFPAQSHSSSFQQPFPQPLQQQQLLQQQQQQQQLPQQQQQYQQQYQQLQQQQQQQQNFQFPPPQQQRQQQQQQFPLQHQQQFQPQQDFQFPVAQQQRPPQSQQQPQQQPQQILQQEEWADFKAVETDKSDPWNQKQLFDFDRKTAAPAAASTKQKVPMAAMMKAKAAPPKGFGAPSQPFGF